MSVISSSSLRAIAPVPVPVAAVPPEPVVQRILLHGVRWETYEMLAQDLDGTRLYMTYDRGDLELMVVSQEHERYRHLFRYIIQVLAEELNVDYVDGGSATMKRKDVAGAIESDSWYYVRHYPQVLGKKEILLPADPPPDLGIEIDVSRSSLNRLGVYANLRVPEVWRFDGSTLTIYHLGDDDQYEIVAESMNYPSVPLADLPALIRDGLNMTYLEFVRHVREWARREVLPGWKARQAGPRRRTSKRRRPRR